MNSDVDQVAESVQLTRAEFGMLLAGLAPKDASNDDDRSDDEDSSDEEDSSDDEDGSDDEPDRNICSNCRRHGHSLDRCPHIKCYNCKDNHPNLVIPQ